MLFKRTEKIFERLRIYSEVRPTRAMTEFIVKVLVEVLEVLATATKEIKQGSASELTRLDISHLTDQIQRDI
jgi:hypothetical protein